MNINHPKLRRLLIPPRQPVSEEPEWMDYEEDEKKLAGNLDDLEWYNRRVFGHRLTIVSLEKLLREEAMLGHSEEPLTILDVATGGGDFPRGMVAWAERRGLKTDVVASDRSEKMLGLAKARTPPALIGDAVSFTRADAHELPFGDGAFDIVTSSFFLHHLDPGEAVGVLAEMGRVARRGVIVNDLVRHHANIGLTYGASRFSRNAIFRHDAMVSVRRAYNRLEMRRLAGEAGLGKVEFPRPRWGLRAAASWLPPWPYRTAMVARVCSP